MANFERKKDIIYEILKEITLVIYLFDNAC